MLEKDHSQQLDELEERVQQASLKSMRSLNMEEGNPELEVLSEEVKELYTRNVTLMGEYSISDLTLIVRRYEMLSQLVEAMLPSRKNT